MKRLYANKDIRVEQYQNVRALFVGNSYQGEAIINDGVIIPISAYFRAIQTAIIQLVGQKALVIGAGGCIIPSMLISKGFTVDVVDPCEEMFSIAKQFFNYQPNGTNHVMTGEDYLENHVEHYDVIFLDAFIELSIVPSLYNDRVYKQLTSMSSNLSINIISPNEDDIYNHVGMLKQFGLVKKTIIHDKSPFQYILACSVV
jgi:hypothetical protein